MDYSLPHSVQGISQARILEWVAISTSRESSWPRNRSHISCGSWVGRWILYPKWTYPFQNTEIWNSSWLIPFSVPCHPKRVSRIWHYLVLVPSLSIASVIPSSHLILWWPLLPLPSIFPSIRGFSSELAVHIIDSELLPRLAFQGRESREAQPPWTLHLLLGGTETLHAVPIFQARKF